MIKENKPNIKLADSKNNTNASIDYVVLSMDATEYRKISSIDTEMMKTQKNFELLDSSCKNCNQTNIEHYKQMYKVVNVENYEKKNVDIKKRYEEYYYLYTECKECKSKYRITGTMYPQIQIPQIKKDKTVIETITSLIKKYL